MAHIVVAELRPRLQACSIFITVESGFLQKKTKISIKPSSITITWISGCSHTVQQISLPGCKLVPNTLSCLCIENEFISFRVQTDPSIGIQGSFSTEILPLASSTNANETNKKSSIASDVASGTMCVLTCQCCGNKLLEKNFQRVLPLPSNSLDSSEWFCHGSTSFVVSPSDNDLLYGICSFIINPDSLLISALVPNGRKVARCQRCQAWLGIYSSKYLTLWDCTVAIGENSRTTPLQDFVKVIGDAVASCVGLMCRVIVETQLNDEETIYILLWVIDKNLQILTNWNTSTNFEIGCLSEDIVLTRQNTVKLLYLYQSNCSSLVKAWQGDVNIQCISVAKSMFTDGLDHLRKTTKCIPHAYRVTNNYLTAFLDL